MLIAESETNIGIIVICVYMCVYMYIHDNKWNMVASSWAGWWGEMNVSNRRVVGVTLPQWSAWETLLENALVKRRPGGSRIVSSTSFSVDCRCVCVCVVGAPCATPPGDAWRWEMWGWWESCLMPLLQGAFCLVAFRRSGGVGGRKRWC